MYKSFLMSRFSYTDLMDFLDQMYEGFLLSSLEGRVFYANEAVKRISGLRSEEIIGKTTKEMEDAGTIINQSTLVRPNYPITIVQEIRTGRKVFITSKPIYDEKGGIICFAANYRNLSHLNSLYKHHVEIKSNRDSEYKQMNSIFKTEGWIGNSFITHQLKEKVTKIAKTDAIILILGESGVGKEVVANHIHKLSHRKSKPYIQINCGAIPKELIEAELFGHEKGAFTGAHVEKIGFFEAANGGTILLDEIGEMPLDLQVKLLRVIQTKKITRVGGTKEKELNVRFIAATNKDLKELVEKGSFREDLYYRINVIPILIPPLMERRDDIVSLCTYFLEKANSKYETQMTFSPEVLQIFQDFEWPGNVRQLENIIERLIIMGEDQVILASHLPDEFIKGHRIPSHQIKPLKEAREEMEIKLIQSAINKFGSIRKAAKHLEVHHSTLVRKMRSYKEAEEKKNKN